MSNFVELAKLDDLKNNGASKVSIDGHTLAVVRFDSDVYILDDRCSHQNYSLSDGVADRDELTLECIKHGSTFSLLDGNPTCLPATRPVRVYEIKVDNNTVYVNLGDS
jgi:3-phenylpropionate/trans-cinnamate dioxygenase ferredoxin subunit